MSKINKIKVNGTPYEVEDKEAVKTVTLTQAEYDALQTKDPSIFYVISDGQGGGGGMTSGEVQTMIDASISGKADTSAVTESIATAVSGKQDTLVSGTNIKTINNESLLGSGNITISGGGSGSSAVEVTQAEYDALVSGGTLDPSVLYIITDAVGGDLSNYMTSAQTMNAISAATSTKQDILSAGTGIDITDNTISVTGGSGGGKAVSGGTNISITTGETADTINCTLPIKKIQGYDSVIIGDSRNTVNGGANVAVGVNNSIIPKGGGSTPDNCFVGGEHNNVYNTNETAFGYYNNSVQNTSVGGRSGTTLFSVGNGTSSARHNAFEIRKNGDIYITSGSTDIKLQDHLGGGGITSGEVQDMIDTSISGKQDTLSAGTNITITNNVISAQLEGGTVSRGDVEDMIEEATSGLQETLSAGTGIEIDSANTISCTVSGKTYSGVSGITINSNDEIYYDGIYKTWLTSNHDNRYAVYWFGGSDAKIWMNGNTPTSDNLNYLKSQFSFGRNNLHSSTLGVALGQDNHVYGYMGSAFGLNNNSINQSEHSIGQFNNSVTASTTFGDSGNTLFSVGNGTANNARHNAFEIRQNGDIYITSGSTDIKLQDHLGGGGGGGLDDDTQLLLSTALTDLNDRKADLSEVRQNYQRKGDYATKSELAAKANVSDVMTLEKAKENEQVTSYALNNLNDKFGGMKLVKITESEYAALTTKDENTLYVVIADPE